MANSTTTNSTTTNSTTTATNSATGTVYGPGPVRARLDQAHEHLAAADRALTARVSCWLACAPCTAA